MIFRQYDEILRREKTETRRMHRPKLAVGKDYAVVPKRGKPAHWFHACDTYDGEFVHRIDAPREYVARWTGCPVSAQEARYWLSAHDAVQVRICIEGLHSEPLHRITLAGALHEGVATVQDYAALWDSINTKSGTRWDDNPDVWVVRFHLVEGVSEMYQRWLQQGGVAMGEAVPV